MDNIEKCLFDCSRSGEKLIVGGPDRIRSIIQASISRTYNRFTTLDPEVPVKFHKVCVSSYTSKQHINRVLSSNAAVTSCELLVKRLCRSHILDFNFRRDCLFCGKICLQLDPRNPHWWRKYYQFRTTSRPNQSTLRESMLHMRDMRGDEMADKIRVRVHGSMCDLHAADARYHKDYRDIFYHTDCRDVFMHSKSAKNPVALKVNLVDEGLQKVISMMADDTSIMWNSVELYDLYKCNGGNQISRRTLLTTLQENIWSERLILSSPGVARIVVFRKCASSFMKIFDDVDEGDCLVRDSSHKIRSELEEMKRYSQKYATQLPQDHLCDEVSPSLHHLLQETGLALLPSTLIGHITQSQVSHQATNLQIALGLMLPSKNVISEVHKFGITCSYDKCRRFKSSAAAAAAKDNIVRDCQMLTKGLFKLLEQFE